MAIKNIINGLSMFTAKTPQFNNLHNKIKAMCKKYTNYSTHYLKYRQNDSLFVKYCIIHGNFFLMYSITEPQTVDIPNRS